MTESEILLAQQIYDNKEISLRELAKQCNVTSSYFIRLKNKKLFKTRNMSDASKIGSSGRILTEETRKKISISRTRYLVENPDKVPYRLNHYSKGSSYAEQYFEDWLNKENISFEKEKQESIYSLDFVIKNINLEIDGEQHYVDKRISASDSRRNLFLENLGYSIIRIRWSLYQKLNNFDKEIFLNDLKVKLTN